MSSTVAEVTDLATAASEKSSISGTNSMTDILSIDGSVNAEPGAATRRLVSVVSNSTTTSVVAGSIPSEKPFSATCSPGRRSSTDSQSPTSPPAMHKILIGKKTPDSLCKTTSEDSINGRSSRFVVEDVFDASFNPEQAILQSDGAAISEESGNMAQEQGILQSSPVVPDVGAFEAVTVSSERFVVEDVPLESTTGHIATFEPVTMSSQQVVVEDSPVEAVASQTATPSPAGTPDAGAVTALVSSTPLPSAAANNRFPIEDVIENVTCPRVVS